MPAGKDSSSDSSSNAAQRTTFRPPWVKDGPNPLPVPASKWNLNKTNRRDSATKETTPSESNNPLAGVQLRKTSVTSKEPQENGSKENTFKLPQLRPVPPKEETKPVKEKLPEVKLNSVEARPRRPPLQRMPTKDEEIDRATPVQRNALVREESMRRLSHTPAPPPLPPPAPAMPGMENKKPVNIKQQEKIEQLKKCPKVRPDWTAMLKEIESNRKLRHVECNDRSQPLLPETKETEHFVFESEKPNVHNELLQQIQFGIHLKKTKTNDRSRPMLEGLRKIRRQMTIEEQIQKSVSMASMPPEEIEDEVDEMDDIDKVRDDLQSTKQMLALEMRNKEAQIRENKRLLSRIQNLEAELEKEKTKSKDGGGGGGGGGSGDGKANEKLIASLKQEAQEARKNAEEVEKKYKDITDQLDNTKFQLDESKKQNQQMEKKLQEALQGKRQSICKDMVNGDESEDEIFGDEISEESEGEETEEKRERRALREVKIMRNKLRNFKNKEDNAKKERVALRDIMKRTTTAIKEEKKKYKALQKEVEKMASLMKDVSDEEEDEEEEESEEEAEEEESSEESDSESSDDDSDSERSQSEAEDAPPEKKKANLSSRNNRHEKILAALKKGNLMLKTNAERLQDDLNKQKDMTIGLQHELDSVLCELG